MKYLTDRTEIAMAMNFGKYPVIRIDRETPKDGYNDFYEGDQIKVLTPKPGYPDSYATGKIYYSEGKYGVMTDASCLHASFGYADVLEMIENAQAPVVKAGQEVVLIEDYPERRTCCVRIMKVSDRVDSHVYPCATLEDVD